MSTVICAECGERSPAGVQFCGRCGAFLEWEDAAAPDTAVATTPDGPGPVGPPAPPPGGSGPVGSVSVPEGAMSSVPGGPAPSVPLAPPPPDSGVGATAGPVTTPGVVRPGEGGTRRQVTVPDEPRPLAPDEAPCPRCAAGNAPGRRFCRACGAPLAATGTVARPSWWRRLLRRLSGRRAYDAGTRRRVRSGSGGRRAVLLAVVALLVLLAVVTVPTGLLRRADEAVRDRLIKPVAVTPTAVRASSAVRGSPATNVSDRVANRYWAPAGRPAGAWIEMDLPEPVRVLQVTVTPGVSTDARRFGQQGRPHEVEVTTVTADGVERSQPLTLRDEPGPQEFTVKGSDAVRVRLTIRSTFGMPPGRVCGLGEFEVFARD